MSPSTLALISEIETQTGLAKARPAMLSWFAGVAAAAETWDPNPVSRTEYMEVVIDRDHESNFLRSIRFFLYGAPLACMEISGDSRLRGWAVLNPAVN